jgi:hypothetical protein
LMISILTVGAHPLSQPISMQRTDVGGVPR